MKPRAGGGMTCNRDGQAEVDRLKARLAALETPAEGV